MSPRHPLAALRHFWRVLRHGVVRVNYRRGLLATTTRVEGVSFRSFELADPHDDDVLLHALVSELRPGDVVVDVGAHAGTYSLAAAARHPSVDVVAVEPNPAAADRLRANLAVNGFEDRVRVLQCGLGDAAATRAFYVSTDPERGSFSRPHASAGPASVADARPVPLRRLDALVADGTVPPPDRLKIDAEGLGAAVVEGAAAVIRAHHPTVYFEVHETRDGSDEAAAVASLREWGYELVPVAGGYVCEPATPPADRSSRPA